ncbi:type 1 fimbrial protein [Salmonella enterica]|nr:type 1 fimbrial protein [Salmonella enterica]EFS4370619.1 type 1 fimbrial protein [Salmonella enterica]EIL0605923.1 type 1 fimbrial protein [Salmonella enterica]ELP9051051.1 type 1 fimbrial protein [Salmonella enterica]
MKKRFITHGFCVLSVILSAVMSSPARAASVDVSIEGNVTKSTCTIQSPSIVDMGEIKPMGDVRPAPFTVNLSCQGSDIESFVWLAVVKGVPNSASSSINMVSDTGSFILYLLDGADYIDISGGGAKGFCYGKGTRSCTVEPRVMTYLAPAGMAASAKVRFNLAYK